MGKKSKRRVGRRKVRRKCKCDRDHWCPRCCKCYVHDHIGFKQRIKGDEERWQHYWRCPDGEHHEAFPSEGGKQCQE